MSVTVTVVLWYYFNFSFSLTITSLVTNLIYSYDPSFRRISHRRIFCRQVIYIKLPHPVLDVQEKRSLLQLCNRSHLDWTWDKCALSFCVAVWMQHQLLHFTYICLLRFVINESTLIWFAVVSWLCLVSWKRLCTTVVGRLTWLYRLTHHIMKVILKHLLVIYIVYATDASWLSPISVIILYITRLP